MEIEKLKQDLEASRETIEIYKAEVEEFKRLYLLEIKKNNELIYEKIKGDSNE